MNKIYKVVWSKVKNTYVVVSEVAKANGKSGVRSIAAAAAVAVMLSGGTALAASGNLSAQIVDGQINGSGTLTAVVGTGNMPALQTGNSSGTLTETVTIGGYDGIVLDGSHSVHANAFNAYKTTTITINTGDITTASTADLINTTVFHAQGGNLNVTAGDITLDGTANGFMTQNGGQLTVTAGDIVVEANNGNALQCSYNKEDATTTITADSISLTSTTGAAISSMGGDVTVTVTGDADFEGSNGLNANHGGTVTIEAGGDVTVTNNGDYNAVRGANGGAVTLDATGDVTIEGTVIAEGAKNATNVTVTGSNISIDAQGDRGVKAVNGYGSTDTQAHITIGDADTKNVTITNSFVGLGAHYNGSSIEVKGNELIIEDGTGYGIYAMNGTTEDASEDDNAKITISDQTATTITMASGSYSAIAAQSQGTVEIAGDLSATADEVITTRGNGTVKINEANDALKTIALDGDITFNYDAKTSGSAVDAGVFVNLANDASYLTGNILVTGNNIPDGYEKVTQMNLGLANGAQWTTEGSEDSFVNNLTMDGGIINQESSGEITIDNLSGTGDVVFSDGSGQVNVLAAGSGATLNLMMTGVDADSFSSTDDLNKLANLLDVAEDATSNVTGNIHVDEGLINGAIDMTVDYEDVDKDDLLNGVVKDVRQGTSTTVASASGVAANTAVAWREEDATLSQRLGELRGSKGDQGVWARFVQGEFERGGDFETEYNMFQIGYDKAKGDWHYGLAVNHTEGDTTYAAGSGELSNTSVLAYGTWLGERGHYKDIVAKLGSIDSEYSINAAGQTTKGEYDTY
ncbi:MAG: autotransporter outer membrane beta-barrel domain-containing protein, partial [Selenomonadales bacterium]|nr:autotransporter outer membrane beta-barrel domain-containing protein [Selenomonadales bacterium]